MKRGCFLGSVEPVHIEVDEVSSAWARLVGGQLKYALANTTRTDVVS
jgi:hypothetical protein